VLAALAAARSESESETLRDELGVALHELDRLRDELATAYAHRDHLQDLLDASRARARRHARKSASLVRAIAVVRSGVAEIEAGIDKALETDEGEEDDDEDDEDKDEDASVTEDGSE
jgi:hypothetical protein